MENQRTQIFNLEVEDSRLKTFLQNEIIEHLPPEKRIKFKAISNCGRMPLVDPLHRTANVQLMKSTTSKKAKFWGVVNCKNPFICPTCEAFYMGRHAVNIAAGIDAMEARGKVAFMLTLTLIHYRNLNCFDLTEILYNAWRNFCGSRGGATSKIDSHAMAQFRREFDCNCHVRVAEYTYSTKKGWNPHFHCLFWVDKNRLQEVLEWEEKLRFSWHKCLANAWAKHYTKVNRELGKTTADPKTSKKYLEKVFNRLQKFAIDKAKKGKNGQDYDRVKSGSLWISKDEKTGKVIRAYTSEYISGWGADRELTGKPRKQASGKYSMTPHQILEQAANGDMACKVLYTDFILAIKHKLRRRTMYSRELSKIIREWRKTHDYEQPHKKKSTDEQEENWISLVSFTPNQWRKLLDLERRQKLYLRHNILFLAANYNAEKAFQLIYHYLIFYGIDITEQADNYNYWCDLAEQLFNKKINKFSDETAA